MEEIPEILRKDDFRQLMRDDQDFRQIRHKSILKKEQKFTDGMTQLMLNVIESGRITHGIQTSGMQPN